MADGKKTLIDAALKLGSEKRSLLAVGIRELSREAKLSPTAFYRHFSSIEELGLAVVDDIGLTLRNGLRRVRQPNSDYQELVRGTVETLFTLAAEQPNVWIFAMCERHGPSVLIRDAVNKFLTLAEEDMATDLHKLGVIPMLDYQQHRHVVHQIATMLFAMCIEYVEKPHERAHMHKRAERFIFVTYLGTFALLNDELASLLYPKHAELQRAL